MKKNEDEIAELFRSRLSRHEMPLKEDIWENIENELSKSSSKRIYLAAFVAIAAIFMLLLACSAAIVLFEPQKKIRYSQLDKQISKHKCPDVQNLKSEKNVPTLSVTQSGNEQLESNNDKRECFENQSKAIAHIESEENKLDSVALYAEAPIENVQKISAATFHHKKNLWSVGVLASIEARLHSPMSLGISVSKQVTDKIAIESGIRYSFIDNQGTVNSVGIPLKVNYDIYSNNRKFDIYVSGGILVEKNFCTIDDDPSREKPIDNNRIETSITSAIGLQYRAASNIVLFAESGLVYHVDNRTPAFDVKYSNPLNLGIACGVKFVY